MPGENIQDWSTTAATNSAADSAINFAEGQLPGTVNDSARSMMAAVAKDRDLRNGSITTGGIANALTFSSGLSYTSVPTGLRVLLKIGPGLTNTGTTTLNMDGIGAVTIKDQFGDDLTGGNSELSILAELTAGNYAEFRYDGTNWILLHYIPVPEPLQPGWNLLTSTTASSSATVDFIDLDATYDEYVIVINNLKNATDEAILGLQLSINNGSSYLAAGYDANLMTLSYPNTLTGYTLQSQTLLQLGGVQDTANPLCPADCIVHFFGGTGRVAHVFWNFAHLHSAGIGFVTIYGAGTNTGNAGVNAVRFLYSSGNIASGKFRLYGVKI